jgi:serine/threonine-protein kinase RsbW
MQARRAVLDWAQRHVDDRAVLSDIALAVTEATTNVVLHAYRDRDEPGTVIVEAERRDDHICLCVRDEGSGLAPRVDSPGLGLGLGLIAQVADSADVRAPETGGTEVVMRFNVARAVAS